MCLTQSTAWRIESKASVHRRKLYPMNVPLARTSAAMLLCLMTFPSAGTADWHQWRGEHRDGVAHECPPLVDALPPGGLRPTWISAGTIPSAQSGGWSSPVVAEGKVYLAVHRRQRVGGGELPPRQFPALPPEKRTGMSDEEFRRYEEQRRIEDEQRAKRFRYDELVYCWDAETGKERWVFETPSRYTRFPQSSSPAIFDGRLYVLGAGRVARCLDAETGEQLWQTQLPGDFRDEFLQSSLAVADGAAIVLAGWLFGLDCTTGRILWQGDPQKTQGTHTSPVVWSHEDRELVIVNVAGNQTICITPRTGEELWRVTTEGGQATPVVVEDKLITYGNNRRKGLRCFQLSASGAEPLWVHQRLSDPGSSPVVVDGTVFVQGERRLAGVDLKTGKALWSTLLDLENPRYTSLVAADEKIFYAYDGLLCFAADRDEFTPLMQGKVDASGLLAEESEFRKRLKIDELELTAQGQQEAERIWRQQIHNQGPLPCVTPAIDDGKLYLRLKDRIACYDLRKG